MSSQVITQLPPTLRQIILKDDLEALRELFRTHPSLNAKGGRYDWRLSSQALCLALEQGATGCIGVFWEESTASHVTIAWGCRKVLEDAMKPARKDPSLIPACKEKIKKLLDRIPVFPQTNDVWLVLAYQASSAFLPDALFHPTMSQRHIRDTWMLWSTVWLQDKNLKRSVFNDMLLDLTPTEVFKGLKSVEEEGLLRTPSIQETFLNGEESPEELLAPLLDREAEFWLDLDQLMQQDPYLSQNVSVLWPSYTIATQRQHMRQHLLQDQPLARSRLL